MVKQKNILSTETLLQKAIQFLQTNQGADGAWRDFHLGVGIGSQWVTAYVCHSTAAIAELSDQRVRAVEWLLAGEYESGGWGFNEHVLADGDSTANALMALSVSSSIVSKEKRADSGGVLKQFFAKNSEGGCSTYVPLPESMRTETTSMIKAGSGWCVAHPSVTALASEALLLCGDRSYDLVVETAANYLRTLQAPNGYWPAYWWHGYQYATNRATRLFARLEEPEAVRQAARWVSESQLQDGGWNNGISGASSAFHSAAALHTLCLAPNAKSYQKKIEVAVDWLISQQRTDGSWQSTLPLMQITNPGVHHPWKIQSPTAMGLVRDRENIFTTATVLEALTKAQQLL